MVWLNMRVRINLDNNQYFRGLVLSEGEDYITIRDINDKTVYIRKEHIISMKEEGE